MFNTNQTFQTFPEGYADITERGGSYLVKRKKGINKTDLHKHLKSYPIDHCRYSSKSRKLVEVPKVAACCFALCYLTVMVWGNPMPPRVRSDHVARYINFTKIMGKEPIPSTFLTTTELIAARSLVPEEHYIITEDGYILSLYRLYSRKAINPNRPPVLIMHGLMASSDSWLIGKRSTSLPIFLADMGYDVWLGDQRGNANSKRHVFLNLRSRQFWNFSFHESGYYDLPSFIDHVLTRTGHKQLIYIGHSMATAAFLVMTSTKPQYNSKIKLSCLLAPVAYLRHMKELDFILWQLYNQSDLLINLLEQVGLYEIFPRSVTLMQLTKVFCGSTMTQPLCVLAIQIFLQQNPKNIDMERAGFIFSYVPAGSSLKMIEHFARNLKTGRFQYYDFGTEGNKDKYGTPYAPEYDLRNATSPIALYYSLNDIFLNARSVMKTAKELPNVARIYEIPDKKYSHADFVLGLNSKDVLFKDLLKLMKKYD